MYQSRSEDLDPRVNNVLNEGPKIMRALEYMQQTLKNLEYIKEHSDLATVRFRPSYTTRDSFVVSDQLEEQWDYTKEYEESLNKLNESVLDAYITFLEAERETLIRRWNNMAKDLKK